MAGIPGISIAQPNVGRGAARARAAMAAIVLAAFATPPALASPVLVRVGAHGTYGRVVFVVPPGVTAHMALRDDHVVLLSLPGAGDVPGGAPTLNVESVSGGHDAASLMLAPDSRATLRQGGGKVVIDVYHGAALPGRAGAADGGKDKPDTAGATSAPPPRRDPRMAPAGRAPPDSTHLAQRRTAAPPAPPAPGTLGGMSPASVAQAPAGTISPPGEGRSPDGRAGVGVPSPVTEAALPAAPDVAVPTAGGAIAIDSLVAERVAPETIGGGDAILVPFDRGVGAAAFARGGLAHVVFDDGKPVDVAQLKDDPVFASARVMLLPAATDLTLRLAPGKRLSVRRSAQGWVVAVVPQSGPFDAAAVHAQGGALLIGTPKAAEMVVMDDPVTGGRLLVGTVLAPGAAVAVPHVSPEFSLLPSWAGVLVAARSDRLALRAVQAGFSLMTETGPKLAMVNGGATEQAMADAGTLTRHFDFMPFPMPVQRARMIVDIGSAATAPKLARFAPRLRAAQDMLALGLDREAAAMLRLAIQDDPDQAHNADATGLLAMADWMSRSGDGGAMTAAALGTSDEMALWRAVLQPGGGGKEAATVADTWRLVLGYPAPLQRRLLPLVADILLKGGQRPAAEALLARLPDADLDPQRALALRMDGKTDAALAVLDRIGRGRDRKRAAAATRDAVELRLASGKMDPTAAADILDQHLFDWRDDALEADERLRIASLRSQAGSWRAALAMLRETEAHFADTRDRVHALERQVITDLLSSSAAAHLAPLDLVALVAENADLLAEKGASETLAPVLVDKLLALDLPERADPILAKLMAATAALEAKAGLGARLATLRLDQGDAAGAKAALADSEAAGLPQALVAHRGVLQARALILDGAEDAALALLAAQTSPEALELRARLLEKRKDWPGAEAVLQALARATLPADGTLTDAQQDLVLRLASAGSEAGDTALLQRLQNGDAARLAPGPRMDLFQALATRPIQALADLPRSAREAVAARGVPAALASYDAR